MDESGIPEFGPGDVSAVVCSLNSISGIERCLRSLRDSEVGELIVVDADSTDGTRQVAETLADMVLSDPALGLGMARNIGIAQTSKPLILNMGSDNVLPNGELQKMINALTRKSLENIESELYGVSAQTVIEGAGYLSSGLNAWRAGRFSEGPVAVIGTPTLFKGDTLRENPYDPTRRFSDDSELCERWSRDFGATFAISEAVVHEIGKTTWAEILIRCRMYGISDAEIYQRGAQSGWTLQRKVRSVLHPLRVDFIGPLQNLSAMQGIRALPFLAAFTAVRYFSWLTNTAKG